MLYLLNIKFIKAQWPNKLAGEEDVQGKISTDVPRDDAKGVLIKEFPIENENNEYLL